MKLYILLFFFAASFFMSFSQVGAGTSTDTPQPTIYIKHVHYREADFNALTQKILKKKSGTSGAIDIDRELNTRLEWIREHVESQLHRNPNVNVVVSTDQQLEDLIKQRAKEARISGRPMENFRSGDSYLSTELKFQESTDKVYLSFSHHGFDRTLINSTGFNFPSNDIFDDLIISEKISDVANKISLYFDEIANKRQNRLSSYEELSSLFKATQDTLENLLILNPPLKAEVAAMGDKLYRIYCRIIQMEEEELTDKEIIHRKKNFFDNTAEHYMKNIINKVVSYSLPSSRSTAAFNLYKEKVADFNKRNEEFVKNMPMYLKDGKQDILINEFNQLIDDGINLGEEKINFIQGTEKYIQKRMKEYIVIDIQSLNRMMTNLVAVRDEIQKQEKYTNETNHKVFSVALERNFKKIENLKNKYEIK